MIKGKNSCIKHDHTTMCKNNSLECSKFKGCSQLKLMPEFSFTTEKYYTETGMIYGAGKDTDAKRQGKII